MQSLVEARSVSGSGLDRAGTEPGGIWAALEARLDPVRERPSLAPDIETNEFVTARGERYSIVLNPRDLVYYRLEAEEAALLPLMDGTRTVADLVVAHLQASGELEADDVGDLVRTLREAGFLTERFVDSRAALAKALETRSGVRLGLARAVKNLSIEYRGVDRFVRGCYRHVLRPAFTPVGIALSVLVALGGIAAFAYVVASEGVAVSTQSIGLALLLFLILDAASLFIHEMGHASTLVHYGRRVNGAGFRIYFGTPAFYIESSDALMLTRGQRIMQSFAGPYFQLVAAGVASLVLVAFPDAWIAPTLYRFVVLNYFILLLNLIPLLELDGYFILAEALRIPDLRSRSLAFVRHELPRRIWRRERFRFGEMGLAVYGILGMTFTAFTFYLAAYFWPRTFGAFFVWLWEAGPLGVVTMIVIIVLLGGPIFRALLFGLRALGRQFRSAIAALRFRAQRHWRVEAAQLLDEQPVFNDLPVATLSDIAGRVRLLDVGAGAAVVHQGDRADAYFMVRQGTLQAIDEPPDGPTRVLRTLGRGDAFGELAVATGSRRTATVRAVTGAEVFRLDKGSFDRLLADQLHLPDLAPTFQDLMELQALKPFVTLSTDDLDRLRDRGNWVRVGPGETVVAEGQPADAFYVVQNGRLEVFEGEARVRELGAGDHFGEIALLFDVARTATVRTTTPCRLFSLDRPAFDDLVRESFRSGTLRPAIVVDRTWDH